MTLLRRNQPCNVRPSLQIFAKQEAQTQPNALSVMMDTCGTQLLKVAKNATLISARRARFRKSRMGRTSTTLNISRVMCVKQGLSLRRGTGITGLLI